MIQVRIYIPKNTYIYKTLNKRGFISQDGYKGTLFIWMEYKPCIGELIEINGGSIAHDDKLKAYLWNRNKPLLFRINDLKQSYSASKSKKYDGISVLELKVTECDDYWL